MDANIGCNSWESSQYQYKVSFEVKKELRKFLKFCGIGTGR